MTRFLPLLFICPLLAFCDVKINHLITGPKPEHRDAIGMFLAGKGGAAIDLSTGVVALQDCTPEEFANALWDIIDEKMPPQVEGKLPRVGYIQFGQVGVGRKSKGIRLGLYTGKVRWPGVVKLDQASREAWDAVVTVFNERYPNGRK